MAKLFNRAKMTTSTTGSGTVTLSAAAVGFQSFADAGVSNGDVVQYLIEEGAAWELGTGTYSSTGTSLTRTPSESSDGGTAITLAGAASVAITAVADDLNRLQHEGSTKVSVSATGASVTGALTTSGDLTVNGEVAADLSFGDNTKAKFGAGDDLQIFHDGSDSAIKDVGTGNLYIQSNGAQILLQPVAGEQGIIANANGDVGLYYDNSLKLSTTSAGVSVSNELYVGGNDTGSAGFIHVYGGTSGEGGEIKVYASAAEDTTVDHWSIDVASDDLRIFNSNGDMAASFIVDGGVELYYDNSKKFHTYSGGGYVTGSLYASQSVTIGTGGNYQAGSLFSNGDWGMIFRAAQLNPTAAHFMWADYSNNELMRLNTSGNLSIGTTVGSNKLVLGGETAQYPEAINILETGHATSTRAGLKTGGWVFGQDSAGSGTKDFFIYDGNTSSSRLTIDTSGRLSLGLLNPFRLQTGSVTLDCTPTAGATDSFVWNTSADAIYRWDMNGTERMRLHENGKLQVQGTSGSEQALLGTSANKLSINSYDNNTFYATLASTNSTGYGIGTQASIPLYFMTNNTTKVQIDTSGNMYMYGTGTGDLRIELGANTTGNHYAYIDLIGDATYTDYGLRMLRGNTGPNTHSVIEHRGTGDFYLSTFDAAPLVFRTSNAERMRLDSGGRLGIGTSAPTGNLTVYENITSVPNYYDGLQVEVRATTGTAGIGLHRAGYSHVGIYHDQYNRLSFNMSTGTVHMYQDVGAVYGTGNSHPSKQWVNFNGQGTVAIRNSWNTSSITDNGTGNYTINISSAFSAVDYAIQANATWYAGVNHKTAASIDGDSGQTPTTSTFKIRTWPISSGDFDPEHVYTVCHDG